MSSDALAIDGCTPLRTTRLPELLAAIAVEQFGKVPEITRRKTVQAERLLAGLAPYSSIVQLPAVPGGCRPNWHVFAVVDPSRRDWVLRALRAEGIAASFHYIPVQSAPYAIASPDILKIDLPVTDRVAALLARLPISAAFTDAECDDVLAACVKVFGRMAARS